MAGLGQIAEISGVVPPIGVLRRDEAPHRDVTRSQRLATQFDDADPAGRQRGAVVVDDARLEVLQQRTQSGQPAGVALGRRDGPAQRGQQVGVDFVDHQSGAALGERHRQRRLGHAIGRQDRIRPKSERLAGIKEVLDVGGIDRLGAGERETQCGQVEFTRLSLPAQPLAEQRISEVGRRCHGAVVLIDELGPQQSVAQEVQRGDLDQLGAEVHRDGQEPDHAHVVEAGQPADHHVSLDVILRADEHRLGVGVDIAMGDHHGLRRTGRTRCQLHQGDIVFAGLNRVDGVGGEQLLHRQDRHTAFFEDRNGQQKRIGDHHSLRLDHVDDVRGVLGPVLEVGSRGGLMQHGQAGAAHPQRLSGRRDLHRCTGQDTHRVARSDARSGQPAGNAPGALMHLEPGVPDRFDRLSGDHPLGAGPGTVEHLVRETAHDDLLCIRCAVATSALPGHSCSAHRTAPARRRARGTVELFGLKSVISPYVILNFP